MKYRVKLTREVNDLISAYVEVEADSPEAAADAALAEADSERGVTWELDVPDYDPPAPEVDSVTAIAEPATQEG